MFSGLGTFTLMVLMVLMVRWPSKSTSCSTTPVGTKAPVSTGITSSPSIFRYSPDFNPIECLWQHFKGQSMTGYLTNDGEALTEKLLEAPKACWTNRSSSALSAPRRPSIGNDFWQAV